jgi:hypothetical protein
MSFEGFVRAACIAAALSVISAGAMAQPVAAPEAYTPSVGQPGKDVVWVPTSQALADRMLGLAGVTAADYVIDLGSGDGRTVITAAKKGARALGIEYNPDLVELSLRAAQKEGVAERAQFVKADLFESDVSRATVITMFLLPELNLRLRPRLLELKPGTRVVSNSFNMGDWEPDDTVTVSVDSGCENSYCTAYLWIVPARVAGTHRVAQGDLVLEQTYQKVSGSLRTNGKSVPVEGKVTGNRVVLTAAGRELRGTVDGNRIVIN